MLLSEFFLSEYIIRDSSFSYTMYPLTSVRESICYGAKDTIVQKANANHNIVAIITTPELASMVDVNKGLVIHNQPEKLYFELHNYMVQNQKMILVNESFISPNAIIASTAIIGKRVVIHDGVEIEDHVQIKNDTIIGANTYIAQNVVIGAIGMQNLKVDNKFFKISYAGGVKIGENCQILANAIIQKPYHSFFTEVGNNTKISVKTSVGHGSVIGDNCLIAGNGTIAGNVTIGNDLWMGPSSTIADGLKIGNNVKIMIGSVVVNNLRDGASVSGNFATDHMKQLKNHAKIKKL
jgi:UDP-3-O-[3-hydroxymyristoyl] glucosamine N-acyltransferase